jgi:hypothetical protein
MVGVLSEISKHLCTTSHKSHTYSWNAVTIYQLPLSAWNKGTAIPLIGLHLSRLNIQWSSKTKDKTNLTHRQCSILKMTYIYCTLKGTSMGSARNYVIQHEKTRIPSNLAFAFFAFNTSLWKKPQNAAKIMFLCLLGAELSNFEWVKSNWISYWAITRQSSSRRCWNGPKLL